MIIEPTAITENSFALIRRELSEMGVVLDRVTAPIVERIVHSTADFEFAHITHFSSNAVEAGIGALRSGCPVVADVNMIRMGISQPRVEALGGSLHCFVADDVVRQRARAEANTRSALGFRMACELGLLGSADNPKGIAVIGNAPTALFELLNLIEQGKAQPALIIGVPVGFVNVIESKDALMQHKTTPWIATKGRKGGSPVAVAIVNALLRLAAGVVASETD